MFGLSKAEKELARIRKLAREACAEHFYWASLEATDNRTTEATVQLAIGGLKNRVTELEAENKRLRGKPSYVGAKDLRKNPERVSLATLAPASSPAYPVGSDSRGVPQFPTEDESWRPGDIVRTEAPPFRSGNGGDFGGGGAQASWGEPDRPAVTPQQVVAASALFGGGVFGAGIASTVMAASPVEPPPAPAPSWSSSSETCSSSSSSSSSSDSSSSSSSDSGSSSSSD